MAEKSAELHSCSHVLWKVEFVSDETGYLAEEIASKVLKVRPGSF